MVMDVFLGETAKEDAVEARVQAVQVDAADMADTGLCLKFREGVMSSMNQQEFKGKRGVQVRRSRFEHWWEEVQELSSESLHFNTAFHSFCFPKALSLAQKQINKRTAMVRTSFSHTQH